MSRMNPALTPATSVFGTILNWLVGVTASAVAWVAPVVQDIEDYMRLIALFGGLIVTALTIIKLCRDLRRQK